MKPLLIACIVWILVTATVVPLRGAGPIDDFNRGIAYLLLGDAEQAKKNLLSYFAANPQATLTQGFTLLIAGDRWEAAKRFKDYLDTDHRSPVALTGISLALSGQGNASSGEYLERALRMNASFAPAQLCLGMEWAKKRNFPAAEVCFQKALKIADLPEYRLVAASVQLESDGPAKALATLEKGAGGGQGSYHHATLSTRALLDLGRTGEAAVMLKTALAARPTAPEALLLQARLLLAQGDARKALSVAKGLKFPHYNLEWAKTMARIHIEQKSDEAEKFLYEVFALSRWDPEVNLMLGQFHLRKRNPILQNWITRSLLAGADSTKVRTVFPGEYEFPDFRFVNLFDAKQLTWLGSRWVAVFGRTSSGEEEGVTLFDPVTLKPLRPLKYSGTFVELIPGSDPEQKIFATSPAPGERVSLYLLKATAKGGELVALTSAPLKLSSILAARPVPGGPLYLTDSAVSQIAFESPFSLPGSGYRRSTPVFPRYPFPVYSVSLKGGGVREIRDQKALRGVPIDEIQRYFTVVDAMAGKREVADLVQQGLGFDITASESVRIRFSTERPDALIIQLIDLKNPLRGFAFDRKSGRLDPVDGTRLLGSKRYAELEFVAFDPDAGEVTVLTKDELRELYVFNFRNGIYKKLAGKVSSVVWNGEAHTLFVLSERSNHLTYSETQLNIVSLRPFNNQKITSRKDLARCVDSQDPFQPVFSTCHGEMVRLDENGKFHSAGPSWEGALVANSADGTNTASVINGRFTVLKRSSAL